MDETAETRLVLWSCMFLSSSFARLELAVISFLFSLSFSIISPLCAQGQTVLPVPLKTNGSSLIKVTGKVSKLCVQYVQYAKVPPLFSQLTYFHNCILTSVGRRFFQERNFPFHSFHLITGFIIIHAKVCFRKYWEIWQVLVVICLAP